jgi:hypothetical protein
VLVSAEKSGYLGRVCDGSGQERSALVCSILEQFGIEDRAEPTLPILMVETRRPSCDDEANRNYCQYLIHQRSRCEADIRPSSHPTN